jgi:hypothetical protein
MSIISLRLCRSGELSKKDTDDLMTIKKGSGPDSVVVIYNDRHSEHIYETTMATSAVEDYLSTVMHVLSYDKEPFVYVQLNFPLFPIVMLKPEQFGASHVRDQIYKMLETTFSTWYPWHSNAAPAHDFPEEEDNWRRNTACHCRY